MELWFGAVIDYELKQLLTSNFLTSAQAAPAQWTHDCDLFFVGGMNKGITLSSTRATESLKEGKMEGGDTT